VTVVYDPTQWLLSASRSVVEYTALALATDSSIGVAAQVELGFPDTRTWEKKSPLDKVVVHFAQDDLRNQRWAFGIPGVETFDDDAGESTFDEAAMHLLNFDVGVWASPEVGGTTMLMRVGQLLANLYGTAGGRQEFNQATGDLRLCPSTAALRCSIASTICPSGD
jgi:hypothetical protein